MAWGEIKAGDSKYLLFKKEIVKEFSSKIAYVFKDEWFHAMVCSYMSGITDQDIEDYWSTFANCPLEKKNAKEYLSTLPGVEDAILYLTDEHMDKVYDVFVNAKKKYDEIHSKNASQSDVSKIVEKKEENKLIG